jgi:hypothetical protein
MSTTTEFLPKLILARIKNEARVHENTGTWHYLTQEKNLLY